MGRRVLRAFVVVVLALSGLPLVTSTAPADPDCQQVLLVFARGSGEGLRANTASTFFRLVRQNIGDGVRASSVELGDLDGDNHASEGEYPAVDAKHYWGPEFTFNPESSLIIGPYVKSRRTGRDELVNFLNKRASMCGGTETTVLGGYSQGADLIGSALPRLSRSAAASIGYVALFGDPNFNSGGLFPVPWTRGDYSWPNLGGLLGSRSPYVPKNLEARTGSWCNKGDAICTGNLWKAALGQFDEHFVYPDRWMPQAANEIALRLKADHPEWADDLATTIIPIAVRPTDKVDVAFVVDTTGSMSDDIASAQSSINQVTDALFGLATSARVSLVDYKDLGDAYQARVDQTFTANREQFAQSVNALSASGGGDTPESVYSGLMTAFGLDWRPGALKLAITIGDAPAHDPEPGTGYTLDDVTKRAFELDPVVINPIVVGGDSAATASFSALATATKGKVFAASDADAVVQAIKDAARDFSLKPVPMAGGPYTAGLGQNIAFTAAGSFDPEGVITDYAWDFNSDGTVDAHGTSPVAVHSYVAAYSGLVAVTVTATDGETATGTAPVDVAADKHIPRPPAAPRAVKAEGTTDGMVTLTWQAPENNGDAPLGGYHIFTADGTPLGTTLAEHPSAIVHGIPVGEAVSFKVAAVNEYGPSETTSSNTVVVGEGTPTTTVPTTSPSSPTTDPATGPATSPTPAAQGRSGLAGTGTDIARLLIPAAALLLVGLTLVVLFRKRRTR